MANVKQNATAAYKPVEVKKVRPCWVLHHGTPNSWPWCLWLTVDVAPDSLQLQKEKKDEELVTIAVPTIKQPKVPEGRLGDTRGSGDGPLSCNYGNRRACKGLANSRR